MAGPRQARQATGTASLKGARILIVEARFYDDIADALLAGASARWTRPARATIVITVPGALEIPAAIAIALDAAARQTKAL